MKSLNIQAKALIIATVIINNVICRYDKRTWL